MVAVNENGFPFLVPWEAFHRMDDFLSSRFSQATGLQLLSVFTSATGGIPLASQAAQLALVSLITSATGGLQLNKELTQSQALSLLASATGGVQLNKETTQTVVKQKAESAVALLQESTSIARKAVTGVLTPVPVGVSAVQLAAANVNRRAILIKNNSSSLFIGFNNTVTTSNGIPVGASATYSDSEYTGAYYGISTLTAQDIRVAEFFV